MTLDQLPVGARFRLPDCGKTGTVLRHGAMGTLVRYDGKRHVALADRTFDAPHQPTIIAGGITVQEDA